MDSGVGRALIAQGPAALIFTPAWLLLLHLEAPPLPAPLGVRSPAGKWGGGGGNRFTEIK